VPAEHTNQLLRRLVLARRQEDQDFEPAYAEYCRHSSEITYVMGYRRNPESRASSKPLPVVSGEGRAETGTLGRVQ